MKILLSVAMILMSCAASSTASAASCKPDRDWVDAITKQRNIQWEYNLTKVGGFKGMLVQDEIAMFVIVLRWGKANVINIQLTKAENDRDRAGLDSRFRGTKGDRFIFGMKNGEPLSFVAAEVANSSRIQEGAGLVITAILSAHISDKDMATFREALTTKQIDAVRLVLASGQVDRVIDKKNGDKMMEKFSCFYDFLDKNGISLTAVDASQTLAQSSPTSGTQEADQKLDLVVQDILAQDKLTLQATLSHDMAYLDKHIAADAIFKSNGKERTKRMLLAQIMEQQKPSRPIRSRHSAVSSKTTGDVVEVTATTTMSVQTDGGWVDFVETRGTANYKNVNGEWVMLNGSIEYEKSLKK